MQMDIEKTELLSVRGICKSFPGVRALDNVSLNIFSGEVHALLGENGSGKSTLAKCIAGVYIPDQGEITYQGTPVAFNTPTEARSKGIVTIYQEFSVVPSLSVAENIFLGNYKVKKNTGLIDWKTIQTETKKVLDQLCLELDPNDIVKDLSVAEQQIDEIAKAVSMDSSLLIMDEPTAALGLTETKHLMELIRRLTAQGKAIIYISHRLDEVFEIADRVTILKDGRHVATNSINDLQMSDVVRMMIGFNIEQHYPKEVHITESPCLEIENLSTENGVNNVSFTIHQGEVFGLGGMLGSGRTEIASAIYGLDHIIRGKMRIHGKEARFRSPSEAIAQGIGLIPENRKVDGSFFNFEGPKNITISNLKELLRGPLLDLSIEKNIGLTYIKKMNVSSMALERSVQYLSGGNQQKVIIARWLFSKARLLIMDEPTQGIDIGAKLEVYHVINEMTANGISVLLISSDLPELLAMSDRVAVVRDGKILKIAEAKGISEFELISMASGVNLENEVVTQ
jgi:ABC-type sugar transport system ATPase subunit